MHLPISSWKKSIGDHLAPWVRTEDPDKISLFDQTGMTLLMGAAILYFASYLRYDVVPSNAAWGPHGWWGWYDQGEYYKSTIALSHWQLEPGKYWFGYPMLGAPFYKWMPQHPYFIPNIILVLTLIGSFFAACRHFMSRIEAWCLVFIAIFAQGILRESCLIVPWNTLPAYATIYLSIYLLIFSRPSLRHFAICALFAGEALFSRPTEILPITVIYFFGLAGLKRRDQLQAAAFFGGACAVAGIITISLNFYFYDQLSSPYMKDESRKFHIVNYGLKFYQLFCDGTFLTGNVGVSPNIPTLSILERYPIFLFLVPGALYLWKTRGIKAAGLLLPIVATVAFYLTYACCDNMPYFWTYQSFHYIWWILPWLFFLTYLSFRQAPFALKKATYFMALLAPLAFFFAIGFKATTAYTSDSGKNPITVSTTYTDKTFTVNLVAPAEVKAMDIRLRFNTTTSYNGTSSGDSHKVHVSVNGQPSDYMADYFMSQNGNIYDFSFLMHGLALKPGDQIKLEFTETPEPNLAQASLQVISLAPWSGAGRLIASIQHSLDYGFHIIDS